MVQDNKLSTAVYTPPSLPAYLTSTHDLKSIVGIPSDEDVKAIHATVRAVNGMSHIPGMHDPELSVQLAKHLFDVQMAVYRSQYSFSLFPGDIVYTPPPLPSHIPITLQPVVGAPSDEELKIVHSMVRAAENLANSPSMFDSELSLKLSQHLFNINIARYIRDSMHGQLGSQINPPQSQQSSSNCPIPMTQSAPATSGNDNQSSPSTTFAANPSNPNDHSALVPPSEESSAPTNELSLRDAMNEFKNTQEETNRLLREAGKTLKNVNLTLISTQFNDFLKNSQPTWNINFRANDRGELPTDHGFSTVQILNLGIHSEQTIARLLRFYDTGTDLIEDGEEPKIKPGKKEDAIKILRNHIIGI
ncbi:hypothetical protein RSOLAG22IIIB_10501 [Rhizoctonia solani]|uniref:Laminin domain protein n=1 Tax=Rhizoctonia solani TaxID=456999 RepID=A0A0K6G3F9_9AGAM|nr:hypothetical protein RSOLAG22IIIB_10501 [Rhizoctonia solani]